MPLEKLWQFSPALEHHWKNIVEIVHTGMPLEKLWLLHPKLEHHWRDCFTHTHTHIHSSTKLSSVTSMPVWNDKMMGPQISKWTGLCKFSFYLDFTALQWIPVLLLKHHSVHSFDMNTIIVFLYLGLQVKWNQFSSNNSHNISCIHKGLHARKLPDLMTSKPDSVSAPGYHWTNHIGTPLEPQVHWDATGTTLADASTQWCPSGDPVLIYIIGTHGKVTRATSTLGCHWNHTGWC